ncbi:MAG: hypothetical protein IPM42_17745 [Saprospiraceae bacterium]|nr:hypothetical protein [Saprospiraceae bacterium]
MKQFYFLSIFIIFGISLDAQNVGIGTTTPGYKLDVAGRLRLQQSQSTTAGVWFDGVNTPTRSFVGTLNEEHMGLYGSSGAGWNFVMNVVNGNIGIGEQAPAFKLDLNGRMRLKHNPNSSAGIWFDGNNAPVRSFIGTIDNDHFGLWGAGGAGWNFSMNVNNGNTGIGVSAPTAKLDVNGSLRFRSSFPKKGSVMTSNDANGNASWADPVAFKAAGRNVDAMPNFPVSTWTKFYFRNVPVYNIGLAYQQNSAQLGVVETGLYHLDTQIHLTGYGEQLGVRIRLNRGGTISTIATQDKISYNVEDAPTLTDVIFIDAVSISTDAVLEAGDIVWVEIFYQSSYSNNPFPISSLTDRTWFSGHLVARL